ncbi:MAG: hypothetical protein ACE5I5_11465 [Candidatus Heimdallarchaeota archaeon]
MAINERYRSEILKTIYLIQFDLDESGEKDWETVHERLSQTAIKEEMWRQAEGGKGLRNNELIVQTFKELEEEGLITVKEGKQKAKLYFLTEHGRAWGKEYLRHEPRRLIWHRGTQTRSGNVNIAKISAFVGLVCFALASFNGWKSALGWAGRWTFSITPWPGPWGPTHKYTPGISEEPILMVLGLYFVCNPILTVFAYRTYTKIETGIYAAARPYTLTLGILGLFPGFGWVLGGLCFLLSYYQLGIVLKAGYPPAPGQKLSSTMFTTNKARIYAMIGVLCFAIGAFSMWEGIWGWFEGARFEITPWPGPWGFAPESYPYYPDGTLEGFLPRYGPYTGRFMVLEFYLVFSILLTVLAYRTYTHIEQGNYAAARMYSFLLGIFGLFPGFGWVVGGLIFLIAYNQLGTMLKTDYVPPSTPKSMVYLGSIIVFNFLFFFVTLFGEIISIHAKLENLFSFGVSVFFMTLAISKLKNMPIKSIDRSAWPAMLTSSGVFYGNILFFDIMAFHFPGWWEWFFMPAFYGLIMWTLLRWEMPHEASFSS